MVWSIKMPSTYIRNSSNLLVGIGILAIALGLFLVFFRPLFVFLPEDVKFIGATATDVVLYNSALIHWIQFVFRSWGAFVFSTGVLVTGVAAYPYRRNEKWAKIILGVAGIPMLLIFGLVNYFLGSNFFLIIIAVGLLYTAIIIFSLLHNKK